MEADMDVFVLIAGTVIVIGSLVVARVLLIPGGVTIDDLFRRTDLAWPRGVQEQEPEPWHFERLTPPGHRRAARLAASQANRPKVGALVRRDRGHGARSAR
jgi:hypothetical protein